MTRPFCSICDRDAVPENPLMVTRTPVLALYHMSGIALPGYLVLAPVPHVEDLGKLGDPALSDLARIQARAVRLLLDLPGVRKVYVCSFGEIVPHFHLHLFPRMEGMLEDPECLTNGFPDGPKIFDLWRRRLAVPSDPVEVLALVGRLKSLFGSP